MNTNPGLRGGTVHWLALLLIFACRSSSAFADAPAAQPAEIVWKFDRVPPAVTYPITVLGAPGVADTGAGNALQFDGKADGLLISDNPIKGLSRFTIQVLICPDPEGPPAQRFFHIDQSQPASRALLEIRLTDGKWCLDTFLNSEESRLTLIDRSKVFPAGKWYWAALVYDGTTMSCYVNGQEQGEGKVAFLPMSSGRTTVGVRVTRTFWFKGGIAQARISSAALPASELQRTGSGN